jgi:anti-sigma B factor antagonist
MLLKLPERVSAKEARVFCDTVSAELAHDRPRVVVDLSQVKQIDSVALHTLLKCMVEVARRDGVIRLAGVSPEAATVLEMTGLDRAFEMFPSLSEAAASFSVARVEAVAEEPSPQPAAA